MAAGLTLIGGCISYHAKPLHPAAFVRNFSRRTLSSTQLLAYVKNEKIKIPKQFPHRWNAASLVCAGWYYSPALRVQRAQLAVDRANMVTAAESPNPSVALSPTYAAKAGAGISPWILGFNFDIPIETAGRREDRMVQAKALTLAGRYDLGQIAWNVRKRIRLAIIDYLFARKQVGILRQQARLTQLIQSLIKSRFKAGDISRPVYTASEIQARQAALALVAAEGLLRQRRIQLAGSMSLPSGSLAGVRLSISSLLKLQPMGAAVMKRLTRAALLNRMDIQSLLAQYRAAAAALKLQIARQYPNIHLGPGYSFNQGANEFTLGFSMILPIFNQNQGAIAAAQARRRIIAAELNEKQTMVITHIRTALSQYQSALRQWRAARTTERQSRGQVRAARRVYQAGAQSHLALAEAIFVRNTFAQTALQARFGAIAAQENLQDILETPLPRTPANPKGTHP